MTRTLPYRGITIQYPGGPNRYNQQSQPFAREIVKLAHDEGFDAVGHWQPQGGKDFAPVNGYVDNKELAALGAMPPTIPGYYLPDNIKDAFRDARDRRMYQIWYEGASWVVDHGTPDIRTRRYLEESDYFYEVERFQWITNNYGYWIDLIVRDDVSKRGSLLGVPTGQSWGNPAEDAIRNGENPRKFVIREDYPYPKRWKQNIKDAYGAAKAGTQSSEVPHWSPTPIPIGVEPDPRASWVGEQLPSDCPFLQVCDPSHVYEYPENDPGRLAFLIFNDHETPYTLEDYNIWRVKAEAKGYSTLVTWWVYKQMLVKAGHTVPGGG